MPAQQAKDDMVCKLLEARNFRIEIHPALYQYRDMVKWAWIADCQTWWLFRTALAWLRGLIWVALVPRRQCSSVCSWWAPHDSVMDFFCG
jgi:hypothetical protein